jgi:menaquinone-specific isochorismate synthase
MTAAMPAGRADRWAASGALATGLEIAARSRALTFIALPAPVAPVAGAAAIVDAFRDQPRVAWSSSELTLVGVGCARELRGGGADRWAQIVRAARALEIGGAVIAGEPAPISALGALGPPGPLGHGTLGGAQPRWLGGAAFAPGAADRAPWTGFGDAWFMLPRWTYVHDGARAHLVLAVDPRDAANAARWHDELALLHRASSVRPSRPQPALVELQRASAAEWRDQIVSITDAIASGRCSKIVAARTCTVALAGAVHAAELLTALDRRHADCVRVLVQPPDAGALIAATPERLVRREGELVRCDALAGTRSIAVPNGEPASARERIVAEASAELLASLKERREHELVVDAIHAALAGCADVDAPAEPVVRVLRHVVHLHTPFRARLREPRHVLELAAQLHPTPAVGGTPRELASEWIRTREPVARGWYGAPVGWFDLDGNGELAVAIRSGVVTGNRAHLWAGAGIVAGSDPERELAETEIKLHAMLGALGLVGETGLDGETGEINDAPGGDRPEGAR